ncbi:unnamed protein product [Didymodactylos carnosus]|uniref:Beta-glucuronidase n=1 Tax=Didymodactylos carnosus TaxID=1234261 RepID=A0A8S2F155_9BILA|nr:unnamed protein product [Didymodactylos carnosus]CAF4175454.1 unnamed protein product [Didymodactylos carnosus]
MHLLLTLCVFFVHNRALRGQTVNELTGGMLFPYENEFRQVRSLDSIWTFKLDDNNTGIDEKWYLSELVNNTISMPVPSSYNDITQNISLKRHVGWAWYERYFYVHLSWLSSTDRIVLRFQAAHYFTMVWINGQQVMTHEGGHLPFECDIRPYIEQENVPIRLTVAVNNTLTPTTLPPGELTIISSTYRLLQTHFDFFNYAGIDRSVLLYTTPETYIDDVTVVTASINFSGGIATSAILTYSIVITGSDTQKTHVKVDLVDADGRIVATNNSGSMEGTLYVENPQLWQPCGMPNTHLCSEHSYLYTLQVSLSENVSPLIDIYRLPHVGIRTITVTSSTFLINNQPFYFHGANAHEDSDLRGKGYNDVLLVKFLNLYQWLHSNSFRTSHYPYSDQFYQIANQYGIVIIDETPAVGLSQKNYFSPTTLAHHKQVIGEMIRRDKNHPSVVMWSLANEPSSNLPESDSYFETLVAYTRSIQRSSIRPITFVSDQHYSNEKAAQYFDVICINKYFSWYSEYGRLDRISVTLTAEVQGWWDTFKKPVIISEYGADTVTGLHADPPVMFSEEYQQEFLKEYHLVFDMFSSIKNTTSGFLVGELIWNAFDFETEQGITRVGAKNYKGIFTRQRQPKSAAFVLRKRYENMENNDSQSSLCTIFK